MIDDGTNGRADRRTTAGDAPFAGGLDRLAALFEQARAVPAYERAAWIDEHCAGNPDLRREVVALLEADGCEDGPLDRADLLDELAASVRAGSLPTRIGPYAIVRRLGGGGMATVYEAAQDAPSRRVALKLLRPCADGSRAAQRLLLEAEVLARMRHPAIAQVYEAGLHEVAGELLPYLTLEFVPGALSIVEHVRTARPDRRRRLQLFLEIADGVAHAHARGVLHRDLKPDNVLIDDAGRVKIVDFGVARSLEPDPDEAERLTVSGQLVGTIQYMSPEQVGGARRDVDVRADVYALGLLLHEILLGRRPYEVGALSLSEAAGVILESEPALGPGELQADLRAVLGRALAKERDRRYPTVETLATDVRRYLDGLPVEARPPGTWDVLWRAARRNPRLCLALAALLITIIGAAGVSLRLLALAARENRHAKRAQQQLEEAAMLLGDVVLGSTTNAPDWRPEPLIESLARELEADVERDPAVAAVFHTVLARARAVGGDGNGAERELEVAVELWRAAGADHRFDVVGALARLVQHRGGSGDAGGARTALRAALALRATLLGQDHLRTHPDETLRVLVDAWLPEHPLAASDGIRADLDLASAPDLGSVVSLPRSAPTVPINVDLEHALGGPGWSILFDGAEGWSAVARDRALVVDAISETGGPERWRRVHAYRHPFATLGDFELSFRLSWDARGPDGAHPGHSMHLAMVEVHTVSNGMLARAGVFDSHLYHSGGVSFDCGVDTGADGAPDFASGPGSLPYVGSARVSVVRRDGRLRYGWNGRVLFEARDPRPVNGLMIHVGSYPHRVDHNVFEPGADRPSSVRTRHSHFGTFEMADLELRGVPFGEGR